MFIFCFPQNAMNKCRYQKESVFPHCDRTFYVLFFSISNSQCSTLSVNFVQPKCDRFNWNWKIHKRKFHSPRAQTAKFRFEQIPFCTVQLSSKTVNAVHCVKSIKYSSNTESLTDIANVSVPRCDGVLCLCCVCHAYVIRAFSRLSFDAIRQHHTEGRRRR